MESQTSAKTYPWHRFYPKSVPYEINPDAYPSLVGMIEEGFHQFRDLPAYACMGKQITFGELDTLSTQFASFLQNDLGLKKWGSPGYSDA